MAGNNKNLDPLATVGEMNGNGAALAEASNRLKEKDKSENLDKASGMLGEIFLDERFKKYSKSEKDRKRLEKYRKEILTTAGGAEDGLKKSDIAFFAIDFLEKKPRKPKKTIDILKEILGEAIKEEENGSSEKKESAAPEDAKDGGAKQKKRIVASHESDIIEENNKKTKDIEIGIKMEEEKEKRKKSFESRYGANVIYEKEDGGKTIRFTLVGLIPGDERKNDRVEVIFGGKKKESKHVSWFFDSIEENGFKRGISVEEFEKSKNEEKERRKAEFEKEFGMTNTVYSKGKGKGALSFTLVELIPGDGINKKDIVKIKDNDKKGKEHRYTIDMFREIVKKGFKREAGIDERKDDALASLENANKKFMDFLAETASQNADPDMISFRKKIRNAILESMDKLDREDIPAGELKEIKFKLDGFLKMDLAKEFDNFKKEKVDKSGVGKPEEETAKARSAEAGELSEAQKKRKDSFTKRYGENVDYVLYKEDFHTYAEKSFLLVGMIPGETRSKDRIKIITEDGEEKLITSKEFLEMRKEGYKKEEPAGEDEKKEDAGEIIEDTVEASIEASTDDEESGSGDSEDAGTAGEGGDLDVEVDVEVGFSEKEKKIMEGSEKIVAAFIEKQKNDFDFDNFPKKRLKGFLETQAVKFLMDKFKSYNIFRGKEEDVAEVIVEKIKDKF
ncbi:MAG: hypothetical protein PHH24_02245 [Candidatus Moranbacteria bacterium]|nr:hypothetical protein [Candidatus Moranbacteria bacterium]